MPDYERTHARLRELAESISLSTENVRRAESKGNNRFAVHEANRKADEANRRIEDADLPENDGIPPSPPTGVELSAFARAISVTWDMPPEGDHVDRTLLVVTNTETGESRVQATRSSLHVLQDLDLAEYRVRLAHVDRWGLQSDFTPDFVATPLPTTADRLAENLRVAADRIEGVLGEDTLPEITDAAKLYTATRDALVQMGEQEQEILHGNLIVGRTIVGEQLVSGTITADSGVLAEGSVGDLQVDRGTANRFRVLDADIMRAGVNRLVVKDGDIETLRVSKLTGGDISTEVLRLINNGELRAGSIRVNPRGIQMPPQRGYGSPSSEQERKISSLNDDAAYGFFFGGGFKGNYIRGDGDSDFDGAVSIEATRTGNRDAGSSVALNVLSDPSGGYVLVSRDLRVLGEMGSEGRYRAQNQLNPVTLADGQEIQVNTSWSNPSWLVHFQVASGGFWHPVVDSGAYNIRTDGSTVRLRNNRGATRTVRAWIGR